MEMVFLKRYISKNDNCINHFIVIHINYKFQEEKKMMAMLWAQQIMLGIGKSYSQVTRLLKDKGKKRSCIDFRRQKNLVTKQGSKPVEREA